MQVVLRIRGFFDYAQSDTVLDLLHHMQFLAEHTIVCVIEDSHNKKRTFILLQCFALGDVSTTDTLCPAQHDTFLHCHSEQGLARVEESHIRSSLGDVSALVRFAHSRST